MKQSLFLMKTDNYIMNIYNSLKIIKIKQMVMEIMFQTIMDSLYLLIIMEINLIDSDG